MSSGKHVFRFFGKELPENPGVWSIEGDELIHLAKSLRIRIGGRVEIFDGFGKLVVAEVTEISKVRALLREQSRLEIPGPPNRFGLAVGALKFKAFDTVLPSLVELGVTDLHVFLHSGVEKQRIAPSAVSRWERLVLAATKQCKRCDLMLVRTWSSFSEMISFLESEYCPRFVLTPTADRHLIQYGLEGGTPCAVLGSESGLSEEEESSLLEKGFQKASIGSHILTARTAAVATAAVLSANTPKKN